MAKGIYKRGKIYWIRYAGLDGKTALNLQDQGSLIKLRSCISTGKTP
ncbi:MAG: hypothetical protein H6Q54_1274 [Deltaproteobacteria bacterium]|nr:hypothetical protein [Deltaproteobacteria bacterium]